ncbi:MAG: SIMPL domain-containing protein [Acidobacteriia bacterium]|nr:SIMPL domain-containing protein [Terriglobia bacterium]
MRTHMFQALGVLCAASAWGQPAGPVGVRPASVMAAGEAVVSVKPDLAKINIGVLTQAPSAQAASSQNAAQVQAVLDKLRSALGPRADIRTAAYTLSPNYQYPRPGGQPTIAGYSASNTVEITTADLAGVGKLIDAATQAGATNIQQLQFTLKDEAPVRAEALRQASAQARANAEAMAAGLGLKLGKVLWLDQGTTPQVAPRMMQMAGAANAATPVEEGNIEVRAAVTLTIALE